MRITLTALIFVVALQAAAQNTPATAVFDTQTAIAQPAIAQPSQPVFSIASPQPTKARVFDRKFLVLAGIATAATMLDVATTSHCMSTYADCQEGNPLLGSHPSTAKLYRGQLLDVRRSTAGECLDAPQGAEWKVVDDAPDHRDRRPRVAPVLNVRTMPQLSRGQ